MNFRNFLQKAFKDFWQLWLKIWPLIRSDFTAISLIAGNIISIIWVIVAEDWWASIIVLYTMELVILGFYAMIKFPFIHWLGGTLIMPLFALVYWAMLQFVLVLAGAVVEAENGGPFVKGEADFDGYIIGMALASTPLFISHGISFFINFIGKRQWRELTVEQNLIRGLRRIVPIFMVSIPVAIVVILTGAGFLAILLIVPLKIAWDLVVHFTLNELV